MRRTSWTTLVKAIVVAAALAQVVAIPAFANSGNCGGGYGCPGR